MNKNLAGLAMHSDEERLKEKMGRLKDSAGISNIVHFLTGQKSLHVDDVLNSEVGNVRISVEGVNFEFRFCYTKFDLIPGTQYPTHMKIIFCDNEGNTMNFPELDGLLHNTRQLSTKEMPLIIKTYLGEEIRKILLCNIDKEDTSVARGALDKDKDTTDVRRMVRRQIQDSCVLEKLRVKAAFLMNGLNTTLEWSPSSMAERYLTHIGYGSDDGIDTSKVLVELRNNRLMYDDGTQEPEASSEIVQAAEEDITVQQQEESANTWKLRELVEYCKERLVSLLSPRGREFANDEIGE